LDKTFMMRSSSASYALISSSCLVMELTDSRRMGGDIDMLGAEAQMVGGY
jgi:hypothetical protein